MIYLCCLLFGSATGSVVSITWLLQVVIGEQFSAPLGVYVCHFRLQHRSTANFTTIAQYRVPILCIELEKVVV